MDTELLRIMSKHTVWALAMTMGGDAAELRSLARQMLGLSIWPTFDRSLARHSNSERSYLSAIHTCMNTLSHIYIATHEAGWQLTTEYMHTAAGMDLTCRFAEVDCRLAGWPTAKPPKSVAVRAARRVHAVRGALDLSADIDEAHISRVYDIGRQIVAVVLCRLCCLFFAFFQYSNTGRMWE